MEIKKIKDHPNFLEQTLALIEDSFGYDKENSFYNDFYPLMNEKNHDHLYIVTEDDRVIAHIGALTKKIQIKNNSYSFTMFGGIAVSKNYRGKGLFKKLFNQVLNEYKANQAFYLLWSDKLELYQQFGFYPCGELKSYSKENIHSHFIKSQFKDLSRNDLKLLKNLYNSAHEIRPERLEEDWNNLIKMTSIDLYIKRDKKNNIENYFIMNKGQDLNNTIHEYGEAEKEMLSHGNLWTVKELKHEFTTLNSFSLKTGDKFSKFIHDYLKMDILEITEKVKFKFDGEVFNLDIEDFLSGVLGPGRFEELNIPYLYIPGVMSI